MASLGFDVTMSDARERRAQPAGGQLPAHLAGVRQRRLGRAHAATATTTAARNGSTCRCGAWRCSSRRASIRGTQWVVFEPNDEPLWAQIRLNIGAFMQSLFRQGAFQGTTPREAYFVKCDSETTTQADINLGIVNILVGFAPLKPAEFVVIKHPADRRRHPDLSRCKRARRSMAQFPSIRSASIRTRTSSSGVKWDGRYVAGVSKCPALKRTHRGGRAPRRRRSLAPAASRRAAPSTKRSRWSAASPTTPSSSSGPTRCGTSAPGLGREVSLKDFRKDIILEVYNEAGQLALAYKVYRCWVSEYQALPDLDANANAVAIQHIKLENEGWERDTDVVEPAEAAFTEPAAREARRRHGCAVPDRVLGARPSAPPAGSSAVVVRRGRTRAPIRTRSRTVRWAGATPRCCSCGGRCSATLSSPAWTAPAAASGWEFTPVRGRPARARRQSRTDRRAAAARFACGCRAAVTRDIAAECEEDRAARKLLERLVESPSDESRVLR